VKADVDEELVFAAGTENLPGSAVQSVFQVAVGGVGNTQNSQKTTLPKISSKAIVLKRVRTRNALR
jgi:hypothetical protein